MRDYIVKYISTEGVLCSVWVTAESREYAKMQVQDDYWDIKDILMVLEQ